MDAYLICPETKKAIWLGKPIRTQVAETTDKILFYSQNPDIHNYERTLLNKVLWKFLADHAHKELRIVFSGEYADNEYEQIDTVDVEAEEYVRGWPPQ